MRLLPSFISSMPGMSPIPRTVPTSDASSVPFRPRTADLYAATDHLVVKELQNRKYLDVL
jgi:hypothetical protein